MYKVILNFFEFDLSLNKTQFPTKTNAASHVQRQTQHFEFDLSLAEIQVSVKTTAAAHVQSQTQLL